MPEADVPRRPETRQTGPKFRVLFACVGNSARSQMAQGFAQALSGPHVEVRSGGSKPLGYVLPEAIAVMREKGIDISSHPSQGFDEQWVRGECDLVVTMGCGDDACPAFIGKPLVDWDLPDPKGHPLEEFRRVRDAIEVRVRDLLAERGIGAGNAEPASAAGPQRPIRVRPATPADSAAVLQLLRSHAGLEVEFEAKEFQLAVAEGNVLACGRLRRYADGILELASVATRGGHAGRGLASRVVGKLLEEVGEPVYALALAPGFFLRHGFREVPRDRLPASLRAKAEGLCASQPYVAMVRDAKTPA